MQKLSILLVALMSAVASAQTDSDIVNLFQLKTDTFQISKSGVDGLDGTYTKITGADKAIQYKREGDSSEHDFRLVWDDYWQIVDLKDDKIYYSCESEESAAEDEIDFTDACNGSPGDAPPRVGYKPADGVDGVVNLVLLEVGKSPS